MCTIRCHARAHLHSIHTPIFTSFLRSAGAVKDEPGAVKEVHRQYFAAGADIATAASYQGTIAGYMKVRRAGQYSIPSRLLACLRACLFAYKCLPCM